MPVEATGLRWEVVMEHMIGVNIDKSGAAITTDSKAGLDA